jgi:hypothetical protein
MYIGIYVETSMHYRANSDLMVVEQVEITSKDSKYALLKRLKPLLLDGFSNRLASYKGQTSNVGVYISDVSYNTHTNYGAETFFMVVKFSRLLNVMDDASFPNINDLNKMDFSYDETRKIFPEDPTINAICDIERNFWEWTNTRSNTIKLLKEFDPISTIKWYSWTGTLKERCRKHMRRKIINILAKDIKGEKPQERPKNMNITSVV